MNRTTLLPVLFAIIAQQVLAQTAIFQQDLVNTADEVNPAVGEWRKSVAPYFFEEELEDVGPQYLLGAAEKRIVFRFTADFQTYFTSNVNLTENNTTSSSISVGTVQPEFIPYQQDLFGGKLSTRLGLRFQWYRYGIYGTRERATVPVNPPFLANPPRVKNNDFDSIAPYAEVNYRWNEWYGAVGFEYTRLQNDLSGVNFYDESAPYWAAGYTWEVLPTSAFYFQFARDLNDRVDQAFSIIYSHIFWEDLLVQGSYRFQWTGYTQGSTRFGNSNRNDIYNTLSAVVSYYIFDELSVRGFINWQARTSDDRFAADYDVFNGGGGVNVNLNF